MTESPIQVLNEMLAAESLELTFRNYLRVVNKEIYRRPIDTLIVALSDALAELSMGDEFCVTRDHLVRFGFLPAESPSAEVLRVLNIYNLLEDEDYKVVETKSDDGVLAAYRLTLSAFRYCLTRAEHTLAFSEYYSLLDRCTLNYSRYRTLLARRQAAPTVAPPAKMC